MKNPLLRILADVSLANAICSKETIILQWSDEVRLLTQLVKLKSV